jgi:hypothetical protein
MRPSEVILPDSLGLGSLSVMLHAHLPMGVLGGHEPILPSNNGTLPAVQLPLLGKELLSQLLHHR